MICNPLHGDYFPNKKMRTELIYSSFCEINGNQFGKMGVNLGKNGDLIGKFPKNPHWEYVRYSPCMHPAGNPDHIICFPAVNPGHT